MATYEPQDVEKTNRMAELEYVPEDASAFSKDPVLDQFTPEEQKHIIRKVDMRLVPLCGVMYCVSLLDRTNLGAANIAGMVKELNMRIENRYSIVTLVFFITYVLCQPPATICIRKIGPRNFISIITLLWGATMIGFAFTKHWTTLVALRLLLGIFEAGFFPGVVYLLSTWYVRFDLAKRYSFFYMIGACASGFGGILAYGFMQMAGIAGMGGWRWIFLFEGLITCVISLLGFAFLVPFPDDRRHKSTKSFLTHAELDWVIARVQADRGDAILEPFNFRKWISAGADAKIWGFAFIFGSITTATYALAYFLPIILYSGMKFSLAKAQCLVAPPYAFAAIVMYIGSSISDKYHVRAPLLIFNALLCIIGLPIMGFATNLPFRYFGVFLAVAGANANIPMCMTYQANNIRGQWKRAFCSATLVGMGGIGGIVGSTVFREQDAPAYHPGLSVAIGANVLIIFIVGALTLKFKRDNKKADRGEMVIEGSEQGFRYTL